MRAMAFPDFAELGTEHLLCIGEITARPAHVWRGLAQHLFHHQPIINCTNDYGRAANLLPPSLKDCLALSADNLALPVNEFTFLDVRHVLICALLAEYPMQRLQVVPVPLPALNDSVSKSIKGREATF